MLEKLVSTHEVVPILDVAKLLFNEYGRGVFIYLGGGQPFCYALATNHKLNDLDRAMVAAYDPDAEVVISSPMVEGDLCGLYVTSIFKTTDQIANSRVFIPKGEDFELHEKQLLSRHQLLNSTPPPPIESGLGGKPN